MTLLLVHMKYTRCTLHFYGLVHINDIVVSTCEMYPMHIACYRGQCMEITLLLMYMKCTGCLLHVTYDPVAPNFDCMPEALLL